MAAHGGVIFDLDGTLVDSNDAHALTWTEALAEFGFTVPFARVRPLIGMGGDKLLPALVGVAEDSPEGRPVVRRRDVLMARAIEGLRPFPGARALLDELRARGRRLVLASSGRGGDVARILAGAGLDGAFDAVVTASDAERSKPDPDIVQAALAALGPGRAVMVGDTIYDLVAARRAGIPALALRCGGAPEADLADAAAIYDDPADLLARLDGSPLA